MFKWNDGLRMIRWRSGGLMVLGLQALVAYLENYYYYLRYYTYSCNCDFSAKSFCNCLFSGVSFNTYSSPTYLSHEEFHPWKSRAKFGKKQTLLLLLGSVLNIQQFFSLWGLSSQLRLVPATL